jgi:hypothetical protein
VHASSEGETGVQAPIFLDCRIIFASCFAHDDVLEFFLKAAERAQRELRTQNTALSRAWLSAASGATLEL